MMNHNTASVIPSRANTRTVPVNGDDDDDIAIDNAYVANDPDNDDGDGERGRFGIERLDDTQQQQQHEQQEQQQASIATTTTTGSNAALLKQRPPRQQQQSDHHHPAAAIIPVEDDDDDNDERHALNNDSASKPSHAAATALHQHHPLKRLLERWEKKLRIRPQTIRPIPTLSRPLFPSLSAKLDAAINIVPLHWHWLPLWIYALLWMLLFGLLVHFNIYKASTPLGKPEYISCTDNLWSWRMETCGLDGMYCHPFRNASYIIRCPTGCDLTFNQNRRWLGDSQRGFMQPWVVGGNPAYKAESWICPSAIHAGLVSKAWGGCAKVTLTGESLNYPASEQNGVTSLAYDAWFPKSYELSYVESSHCTDYSWAITPVAILLVAFFPLVHPTLGTYAFALLTAGHFYVTFVGIPIHSDDWLAESWARYLVMLAFAYILYRLFIRVTLPSQPSKYLLDLFLFVVIPFFFALHLEVVMAPFADFGLTSRAFREPRTLILFIIGVPTVVIICIAQLYLLRRHGLLGTYILGYALAILLYFSLSEAQNLHIHLHHYTLGLILVPLTRLQTRPSLIFHAFALGLFVQGLSRWGPASPFDTTLQNLAGDEAVWVPRPYFDISPLSLRDTATVHWSIGDQNTLIEGSYDAYSLLLNDVEVYRGTENTVVVNRLKEDADRGRRYYLRVALVAAGAALEYSYPVVVHGNGTVVYQNGTVSDPPV
ncbi:hypothetical protein BC832DRAFT_563597 [Gaertneriomyces semiglobifer]|nr:hypothetical protein BC832DRAFT_563597 [Gaertneriomyces semiglobifer]